MRHASPFSARAAGARRSPCTSAASATTCGCGRATPRSSSEMRARRANAVYLPDVTLARRASSVTHALADAVRGTRSRRVGDSVARLPRRDSRRRRRTSAPGAVIVSATKGLEADTLLRMSEVIAQEVGSGASGRRAVRAQLRDRSRAAAADGGPRGVGRRRRDRARAGRNSAVRTSGSTAATT